MHQKEEFAFNLHHAFIVQSKKFIIEKFVRSKHKTKQGVNMSYAGLIGFCKKHFLTEKLRLYFKNDLTVNTFT